MNSDSVKARLRTQEGCIPHMYKCTGGEVTIGVGHAISDAAAACGLKWIVNGVPAGMQLVQQDFAKVQAALKGEMASHYEPLTSCRMTGAEIDGLLEADIQRFEGDLRKAIPDWESLPGPAQEALFDMGFNLGIGGLQKFKHLLAAVAARDWATAAKECHRMGISDARNQETADLFRQAGAQGVTGA